MIRLARGAWCLDIILLVEGSDDPFESRSARWNTTGLPVPADVPVYTREEWDRLSRTRTFHRMEPRGDPLPAPTPLARPDPCGARLLLRSPGDAGRGDRPAGTDGLSAPARGGRLASRGTAQGARPAR